MVLVNRRRRLGEGSPLWKENFGVMLFSRTRREGTRNHDGPCRPLSAAAASAREDAPPNAQPAHMQCRSLLGKHRRRLIRRIFLGERKQHITPHRGGGGKRVSQVIITRFCLLVHRRRGWSAQQHDVSRLLSRSASAGTHASSVARHGKARHHCRTCAFFPCFELTADG